MYRKIPQELIGPESGFVAAEFADVLRVISMARRSPCWSWLAEAVVKMDNTPNLQRDDVPHWLVAKEGETLTMRSVTVDSSNYDPNPFYYLTRLGEGFVFSERFVGNERALGVVRDGAYVEISEGGSTITMQNYPKTFQEAAALLNA